MNGNFCTATNYPYMGSVAALACKVTRKVLEVEKTKVTFSPLAMSFSNQCVNSGVISNLSASVSGFFTDYRHGE